MMPAKISAKCATSDALKNAAITKHVAVPIRPIRATNRSFIRSAKLPQKITAPAVPRLIVPSSRPTPDVVKSNVLARIGPIAGKPCCAVDTANCAAIAAAKIPSASRRNFSGDACDIGYLDAKV